MIGECWSHTSQHYFLLFSVSPEAIEVQRDLCLAKEQKETEKVPLQEDSKVDENIEQYVIGIGLQNDVGEYNCFLNVIIQVGMSF